MMLPNTEVVGPRNRTEESRCVEGWAEAVHAKLLFVSDSWNPVDCSPPGSSVTLQARRLEGLPRPPPGDLPDPGIEPASLTSPVLAGGSFSTSPTWDGSLQLTYFWHPHSHSHLSQPKSIFLEGITLKTTLNLLFATELDPLFWLNEKL